jgi:hypothetical protein
MNATLTPKDKGQGVFMSDRTRKPWLQPIRVDGRLMPTRLIALNNGYVAREEEVAAKYIRDQDVPRADDPIDDTLSNALKTLTVGT